MKSFIRRLTRRMRMVSFAPMAWWTWKYRNDLRRALPLLKSAPQKLRHGQTGDLLTEAKVLHALATDRRTHGKKSIELCSVRDGVASLRLNGASHHDAVSIVGQVPGVTFVDVDPTRSDGTHAELAGLPEPVFA